MKPQWQKRCFHGTYKRGLGECPRNVMCCQLRDKAFFRTYRRRPTRPTENCCCDWLSCSTDWATAECIRFFWQEASLSCVTCMGWLLHVLLVRVFTVIWYKPCAYIRTRFVWAHFIHDLREYVVSWWTFTSNAVGYSRDTALGVAQKRSATLWAVFFLGWLFQASDWLAVVRYFENHVPRAIARYSSWNVSAWILD